MQFSKQPILRIDGMCSFVDRKVSCRNPEVQKRQVENNSNKSFVVLLLLVANFYKSCKSVHRLLLSVLPSARIARG